MSARIITICTAIAAFLNESATQSGFAQQFTAEHKNKPEFTLEDLATLKVTVTPASLADDFAARGIVQHGDGIVIGVQKKVNETTKEADISGLVLLCEQITEALYNKKQITVDDFQVTFLKANADPIFDGGQMNEHLVFTSVIRVDTYSAK